MKDSCGGAAAGRDEGARPGHHVPRVHGALVACTRWPPLYMTANTLAASKHYLPSKQIPCLGIVPPQRCLAAPGCIAKMLRQTCRIRHACMSTFASRESLISAYNETLLLGMRACPGADEIRLNSAQALIDGFAAHGMHQEVHALIEEQRARGIPVSPKRYITLLAAIRCALALPQLEKNFWQTAVSQAPVTSTAPYHAKMSETRRPVDMAWHGCSTAGEEPPTQGTGLPPRPRLRPPDVPPLVYAALEQGIAAAQSHATDDAAASAGSGAASADGEPDELGGERGAEELAGGADPGPDPAAGAAGPDEGGKRDAEGSAAPSAEALPIISEAIRTLQALGCACLSPDWQRALAQVGDGRVHMDTASHGLMQAHPGMVQPWATCCAGMPYQ